MIAYYNKLTTSKKELERNATFNTIQEKTQKTLDFIQASTLLKKNLSDQIKDVVDNYKNGKVDSFPYTQEAFEFTNGWVAKLSIKDDDVFDVYYVTGKTGTTIPEHRHKQREYIMVIDGKVEMTINGEKTILNSGDSVTIQSEVVHQSKALTDCKMFVLFRPPITVYDGDY